MGIFGAVWATDLQRAIYRQPLVGEEQMTPLLWALLAGMLVSNGFIGYWLYRWVQDKMPTEDIPNWLLVCMFCAAIGMIGVNLWALSR